MSALVSVIITAYNQDAFISQAIQSVYDQTYFNWECIIIDDGSTDNTAKICNDFCLQDQRIKYFHQENKGVSSARNYGYSLSKGSFIHFLDGDDFVQSNKLEIQIDYLNQNTAVGICYTDHSYYFEKNKSYAHFFSKPLNGNPLNELLFEYDNGVSIPIHTAIFRKNIWGLGELPFSLQYPYRYEDWVFWINIALKKIEFSFINENCAVYRIHPSNFCIENKEKTIHALHAAYYISGKLAEPTKTEFLNHRIKFILDRYSSNEKNEITIPAFIKLQTKKLNNKYFLARTYLIQMFKKK